MEYIQTTLFSDTDLDELRAELAKTKNEVGNIRRGFFARHEEILKTQDSTWEVVRSLKDEIQRLQAEVLSLKALNDYALATVGGVGACVEGVDSGAVGAGLAAFASGLKLTSMPVSSFMTSSATSSTGLLGPR